MTVNRRKSRFKSDKEFEEENLDQDIVSKTQQKKQAQDFKIFGLELTSLKAKEIKELPISDVTIDALLNFEKMTSNLARKRHLMFIGKCLRNEDVEAVQDFLKDNQRKNIELLQKNKNQEMLDNGAQKLSKSKENASNVSDFIPLLMKGTNEKIELFIDKNNELERQTLRQLIRNCNSAKTISKKEQTKHRLIEYLRNNNVKHFNFED